MLTNREFWHGHHMWWNWFQQFESFDVFAFSIYQIEAWAELHSAFVDRPSPSSIERAGTLCAVALDRPKACTKGHLEMYPKLVKEANLFKRRPNVHVTCCRDLTEVRCIDHVYDFRHIVQIIAPHGCHWAANFRDCNARPFGRTSKTSTSASLFICFCCSGRRWYGRACTLWSSFR